MYNAVGIRHARRVAVGGLSTMSLGLGVSVSEGMDMKGIALGLAVAGVAAFGFAGAASAAEAPAEVGAVQIKCLELGFDGTECTEAVADALAAGVAGEINGALADSGIDYVVEIGI